MGCNTSNTITLRTGVLQGSMLSPLLFTLPTQGSTATHNTNITKFADDTTMLGLKSKGDETAYKRRWNGCPYDAETTIYL